MTTLTIERITLKNNILCAPMAGITDLPFRVICKENGAQLVTTEMVSAKGIYYKNGKSLKMAEIFPDYEHPAEIQIFGSDPYIMAQVVDRLNDSKASLININMGCPANKIVKNNEGCALMKNINLASQIIKEVCKASIKPITIKMRKGWDEYNVNAAELAKVAEQNGASAVTIHGRTRQQFYLGKVDLDIIKKVKTAVSIPVIGNGDIFSPQDAQMMLDYTGCDGIMIGRGALGNPWIFNQVTKFLDTREIISGPSIKDRICTIIRHMDMLIDYKDESIAIKEMRKHVAWYIKGLKNASKIKREVFTANSREEMINSIYNLEY